MVRRRKNTFRSCKRTFRQRPKSGVKNVPESSRPTVFDFIEPAPAEKATNDEEPANDNWHLLWGDDSDDHD